MFLTRLLSSLLRSRRPQPKPAPAHLRRGQLGESAARRHLERAGLRHLLSNYRGKHGEIDLVFRDHSCLVFVEVKTRSRSDWARPAAAVTPRKRRALSRTALEYLRHLRDPRAPFRFDIVEVLLEDETVHEIRHLPNAFPLQRRNFYA